MITIKCKGCGKGIKIHRCEKSKNKGKRYCTRTCYKKHTTITKECPVCHNEFTVWKSRSFVQYCSVKCAGNANRKHKVIIYKNVKYYKTTPGYYVSRPRGKHGVMLHRAIYEDHNGIKLAKHNTIHHKNGNREDNRIHNLELWTTRHPKGKRVKD